MTTVSVVTGATRNLGFWLARGLGQRLEAADTVYLTGRDPARVADAVERLSGTRAEVRGEVLDVADRGAVERFAALIAVRHGGVDIVLSNHYTRVEPNDDPAKVVEYYVAVNNLGTTRCFAASPRCCGIVGDCSLSQAEQAACARWRRCCTLGSRGFARSTMSTMRSARGVA